GQPYVDHRNLLGGAGPEHTWGRLFLSRTELTALAVLLTDRFAWNLKIYDRMPAPTTGPSVGEKTSITYQVQVEKHRAGRGRWFSTENITDSGADSPGRLVTQALAATAPGRDLAARLAPGTDLLMVSRLYAPARAAHRHQDTERPRPVGPLSFGISYDDAQRWQQAHDLGGSPFQRVRRTTVTREGRPRQHSQSTNERVYVLPDEHVQRESRSVFAAGGVGPASRRRPGSRARRDGYGGLRGRVDQALAGAGRRLRGRLHALPGLQERLRPPWTPPPPRAPETTARKPSLRAGIPRV